MTGRDSELLSRWLDGEVTPEERATLQQDTKARAAIDALAARDDVVRAAFDRQIPPPAPALEAVIRTGFAARRARARLNPWWLPAAAAVAVAVIGLFAFDRIIDQRVDVALQQMRAERANDMSMLATAVQDVLETKQSGAEAVFENASTGFSVRIEPRRTWKSASGHWCREFSEKFDTSVERQPVISIACRDENGAWVRTQSELRAPTAPVVPLQRQDL